MTDMEDADAEARARINWAGFEATEPGREPFDYLVMPGFVLPASCEAARLAFPPLEHGGVVPAPERPEPADALDVLLAALRAPHTTAMFSRKFGLDLDPRTLMITLRGRCREMDGKIHTDSESKVVTALIYLNESWPHAGGRLRLLRGPDDLDDMIAEVTPVDGTLIAFRRTDLSFHGHLPFEGVRRVIMLNWMVDAAAARREVRRHSISAGVKRLFSHAQPRREGVG